MVKPTDTGEGGKIERISEAEHAIMEVLWENHPISAAEVSDAISSARGWSLATVKTLLSD